MLLLQRNGVVEEELRSVFESIRDGVRGEILVEGTRDIGEQEGNIIGRALGEDGGQSGECRVGPISDAWDSAIGEYEDGSDRVGFLLDLSRNTFLGGLVLRNTAIIDEPRSVEDANLRKRLPMLATFIIGGTYPLSEMYIVNFTTVNTPHLSPHVSPRNVVIQGPVKFT